MNCRVLMVMSGRGCVVVGIREDLGFGAGVQAAAESIALDLHAAGQVSDTLPVLDADHDDVGRVLKVIHVEVEVDVHDTAVVEIPLDDPLRFCGEGDCGAVGRDADREVRDCNGEGDFGGHGGLLDGRSFVV